jgi:DNA polymerase
MYTLAKQMSIGGQSMLSWSELEKACGACTKCALYETRTNVVFGVGNRDAEVLFVGEGPGEQEDLKGEPFVGRAGKLLDDMLKIIDLDRTRNIYIANMVKCRPPKNRDPLNTEQDACIDWLRGQFKLLKPKIVVCLGRIAAGRLIGEDFKISRDHGKWYDKDGVRFMALYHPAALLRDPHRRPETFVDLKALEQGIKELCPGTYALS